MPVSARRPRNALMKYIHPYLQGAGQINVSTGVQLVGVHNTSTTSDFDSPCSGSGNSGVGGSSNPEAIAGSSDAFGSIYQRCFVILSSFIRRCRFAFFAGASFRSCCLLSLRVTTKSASGFSSVLD